MMSTLVVDATVPGTKGMALFTIAEPTTTTNIAPFPPNLDAKIPPGHCSAQ